MRKLVRSALLLAAALCLLAGCGQSNTPSEDSAGQGQQSEQMMTVQTDPVEESTAEKDASSAEEPADESSQEESGQTYTDNFSVDEEAAAAFAEKIQTVVADKDLEGLADLMMFPNYVGFPDEPAFVDTREEFLDLGTDRVFTEEMMTEISTADTSALEPSQAGFILSASGCPNIVFGVSEGRLAIVGINY